MTLKIVDVKNPSLRMESKRVEKIDKKIQELVRDMQETLEAQKDPEGVGLAAPQVGKNIQIFLLNYGGENRVIINPKVLEVAPVEEKKKRKKSDILEGCLSLPHYYGPIVRSQRLILEYTTLEGTIKKEEFRGFLAHIVQHEMDHLKGVIFIDRILEQKAPLYKFQGEDWEEVELT